MRKMLIIKLLRIKDVLALSDWEIRSIQVCLRCPKRKYGPKIRARDASRNARWSSIRVIGGECSASPLSPDQLCTRQLQQVPCAPSICIGLPRGSFVPSRPSHRSPTPPVAIRYRAGGGGMKPQVFSFFPVPPSLRAPAIEATKRGRSRGSQIYF